MAGEQDAIERDEGPSFRTASPSPSPRSQTPDPVAPVGLLRQLYDHYSSLQTSLRSSQSIIPSKCRINVRPSPPPRNLYYPPRYFEIRRCLTTLVHPADSLLASSSQRRTRTNPACTQQSIASSGLGRLAALPSRYSLR
jgi:hypothetical protein